MSNGIDIVKLSDSNVNIIHAIAPANSVLQNADSTATRDNVHCKVVVLRARDLASAPAGLSTNQMVHGADFDVDEQIRELTKLASRRTNDELDDSGEASVAFDSNVHSSSTNSAARDLKSCVLAASEVDGLIIVSETEDELPNCSGAESKVKVEVSDTNSGANAEKRVQKRPVAATSRKRKPAASKRKRTESSEYLNAQDRKVLARWNAPSKAADATGKSDRSLEGPFVRLQSFDSSTPRVTEVHNPALTVDLGDRQTVSAFWKPSRNVAATNADEMPFVCALCCYPSNVNLAPKRRRAGLSESISLGPLYGPFSVTLSQVSAERLINAAKEATTIKPPADSSESKKERKPKPAKDPSAQSSAASFLLDATFAQVLSEPGVLPTSASPSSLPSPSRSRRPSASESHNEGSLQPSESSAVMSVDNSLLPSVLIRRLAPSCVPSIPDSDSVVQLDGNADEFEVKPTTSASENQSAARYNVYVHGYCALWAPTTFWTGVELVGLEDELATAWDGSDASTCSVCNRGGATIGCLATRCTRRYHLPCALRVGCEFRDENLSVRCTLHRS